MAARATSRRQRTDGEVEVALPARDARRPGAWPGRAPPRGGAYETLSAVCEIGSAPLPLAPPDGGVITPRSISS